MSRSQRLFDLLDALRRRRRPVSGQVLADEIGVSLRTLYRDIAALQGLGAQIEGEPGVGYILRPGFLLPPLMFTPEELQAVVLGAKWVMANGDEPLREAARNAVARIGDVIPEPLRDELRAPPLLVGPGRTGPTEAVDPGLLRSAIRGERKLTLAYSDGAGAPSERVVWPFALSYFDSVRVLVAWCELRSDFRHFRTDRIASAIVQDARYPHRRQALLKAWRETQGIADDDV